MTGLIFILVLVFTVWWFTRIRNKDFKGTPQWTSYALNKKKINFLNTVPQKLTVDQLGIFEGSISDLKEVIVVCDRIEAPEKNLYKSVAQNFKKGVAYKFLLSKSSFQNERKKYYKIFEGLSNFNPNSEIPGNISVQIYQMKQNWNDYPFIFYVIKSSPIDFIIAYMGTQEKEGIAENYLLIPGVFAKKILSLASSSSYEFRERHQVLQSEFYKTELGNLNPVVTYSPN